MATTYFSTVSPTQGCSSLHGRRTRDRGITDSETITCGSGPPGAPPAPPRAEGVETPSESHQPGPRPQANSPCPMKYRDWGGLPYFIIPKLPLTGRVATFSCGLGGLPLIHGEPDCWAAGRCQHPGAVSTVPAGSGPCPSPAAVSPWLAPQSQARTGVGEGPIPRTRFPPHDAAVHRHTV